MLDAKHWAVNTSKTTPLWPLVHLAHGLCAVHDILIEEDVVDDFGSLLVCGEFGKSMLFKDSVHEVAFSV